MFDWIRKLINKKDTGSKTLHSTKPIDLGKRWRYGQDGITKINVDD